MCASSSYFGSTAGPSQGATRIETNPIVVTPDPSEGRTRHGLEELEAIYAAAPIGLAVISTDGRFERVNERLASINGLPVSAHLGRSFREVLPQVADFFEGILHRVVETGEPVLNLEVEGETWAQPGTKRAWMEHWLPHKDVAGKIVGVNVVVEEITERKAAEAALRQLTETLEQRVAERTAELEATSAELARLASVAENSPDFIGICDLNFQTVYVNPAGRRLVGIQSDEELKKRTPHDYFIPQERGRVEQEVFPAVLRDGHWVGELTFRHFRTEECIPVLYDVFRIDDPITGEPSHYATVTRDLRERKKAEDQLRHAQKMEAVGQLTGGIAHDFNNLLTVVMGNLELLAPHLADQPRLNRMVQTMQHATEQGAQLTGQLLAFSRRQTLQPQVTDINSLIGRFEPLVRRLVGEAVELEVNLCPGLWPCKIDAAQLEAALLNLAANARDAMPDGGKLTIETRNSESDSKVETRVAGAGPGPYVVITVRDTGCGMSPEVVAHAFEPFFTTKEVGKGSGLGLSQAYGFVKQSGGHVTIDTEVGAGTLISLYLPPTNSASAVTVLTAATQSAEPARGSERILVVEDNADVLRTVTEMLKDLGYAVRGALSPQKALEVLQSNKRIDLLFSDMVLPHMGGRRLIEEARRLRPNLKVLLTSGYSRERVSHSASMDEGMSVIAKPYKKAELAVRLRAVLDS